jgi:hypothetical protein
LIILKRKNQRFRIETMPIVKNRQLTTKNTEGVFARGYKNLIVYQKAKTLTTNLIKFYSEKKLGWTEKYLVDQLLFELEYWIDVVSDIQPQNKEFLLRINRLNTEVLKMLTVMMKNLEQSQVTCPKL